MDGRDDQHEGNALPQIHNSKFPNREQDGTGYQDGYQAADINSSHGVTEGNLQIQQDWQKYVLTVFPFYQLSIHHHQNTYQCGNRQKSADHLRYPFTILNPF